MTNSLIERIRKFNIGKRKPNRFIVHLAQQAEIAVEGCDILVAYMKKPNAKNANDRQERQNFLKDCHLQK